VSIMAGEGRRDKEKWSLRPFFCRAGPLGLMIDYRGASPVVGRANDDSPLQAVRPKSPFIRVHRRFHSLCVPASLREVIFPFSRGSRPHFVVRGAYCGRTDPSRPAPIALYAVDR